MFGLALALFLGLEAVLSPGCRALEVRRWGVFCLLASTAALLRPNGMAGFVEPFRLTAMPALQSSFTEWLSPDFHAFQPLEIWLLGVIALGLTTGARLPLSRVLLLLVLCHMALAHVRHAELLGFVAPLAIAASLGPQLAAKIRSSPLSALGRGVARLAAPSRPPAVALAVAVAAVISLPLLLRPIERTDDPVTPAAALAAAVRMGLEGPVFNNEGFGGYLIFSGVPVFIDGRAELYRNEFLGRYIAAENGDGNTLAELLDEYGIVWTILVPQQAAASRLDGLPGWRRVYSDNRAVIHTRAVPPTHRPRRRSPNLPETGRAASWKMRAARRR
jgi:hypothetical protein